MVYQCLEDWSKCTEYLIVSNPLRLVYFSVCKRVVYITNTPVSGFLRKYANNIEKYKVFFFFRITFLNENCCRCFKGN